MKSIGSALTALKSGEGLKGQLMRGGVGSIAIKIASTGLNLVLAIILARLLGAEGFGLYSFVFALVTIMAIPAQMGLPNLVVRETAKAQATGDWALMKGLWRWSTLMALGMSLILMTIGALGAWLFASSLPEGGLPVFYWGLVLVPLVALGNLRGAALRGLRHVVQGQLPEFVLRPAFLIALMLAVHFSFSAYALSASDAMMLHALASLMAFAIGAYLLLRERPQKLLSEQNYASRPRLWIQSAIPLGLVDGMQLINSNVGLLILGLFSETVEAGLFRIALQGGFLVGLVLTATNLMIGPYISRLYEQNRYKELQKLASFSALIAFIFSVISTIVIILLGPDFVSYVFGAEFSSAYVPLIIISLAQVLNSLTGCVGQLLYMSQHEGDVAQAVAVGALVNALFAIVLVPSTGVLGAAIAVMISTIVWNAILLVRVWFRMRIVSLAFW